MTDTELADLVRLEHEKRARPRLAMNRNGGALMDEGVVVSASSRLVALGAPAQSLGVSVHTVETLAPLAVLKGVVEWGLPGGYCPECLKGVWCWFVIEARCRDWCVPTGSREEATPLGRHVYDRYGLDSAPRSGMLAAHSDEPRWMSILRRLAEPSGADWTDFRAGCCPSDDALGRLIFDSREILRILGARAGCEDTERVLRDELETLLRLQGQRMSSKGASA